MRTKIVTAVSYCVVALTLSGVLALGQRSGKRRSPALDAQLPSTPVKSPSKGGKRAVQSPLVQPLTMGECLDLGGAVTVDLTCPETTTVTPKGGSVKGRFRCKGKGSTGAGICIDEDYGTGS